MIKGKQQESFSKNVPIHKISPSSNVKIGLYNKITFKKVKNLFYPEAGNPALKCLVFSNRMLGRVQSSVQLAILGLKAWVVHSVGSDIS
jgi:hypothetical protein